MIVRQAQPRTSLLPPDFFQRFENDVLWSNAQANIRCWHVVQIGHKRMVRSLPRQLFPQKNTDEMCDAYHGCLAAIDAFIARSFLR